MLVAGVISVGVGIVGIVVPLLPTTPFLLIAAACFVRSSEKLHRWLTGHRWLGPYIRNYQEHRAITNRTRVVALLLLWGTLGYSAFALKPAGKTLSMTLRMAAEAHRRGAPCFVADSACPPILVDWNKNVAARLAPLPGLATGLLESNGPQHYRNWQRMLREHPCHGAPWLSAANGVFDLGRDFYDAGGGIFSPPDQSDHAGHSHV